MIVGIVGSEAAKFTPETEVRAKTIIRMILSDSEVSGVSSGRCHLGGIDIWAEEIGQELNKNLVIFPPATLSWPGYKARNIQIAEESDIIYCITVKQLPPDFKGMRFAYCYHCKSNDHIKSGGCWTAKYAQKIGKTATWVVI